MSVFLTLALVACIPVEGGPTDMGDVEEHLDLVIGHVPEGCDPVGLDGDGRGRIVGAGFDCAEGATLRIERFDSELNDDPLPASPAETGAGRVEWRDGQTGDVIRIASDDLDIDVVLRVARLIEVLD